MTRLLPFFLLRVGSRAPEFWACSCRSCRVTKQRAPRWWCAGTGGAEISAAAPVRQEARKVEPFFDPCLESRAADEAAPSKSCPGSYRIATEGVDAVFIVKCYYCFKIKCCLISYTSSRSPAKRQVNVCLFLRTVLRAPYQPHRLSEESQDSIQRIRLTFFELFWGRSSSTSSSTSYIDLAAASLTPAFFAGTFGPPPGFAPSGSLHSWRVRGQRRGG